MQSIYKLYGTDKKLEEEGIILDYGNGAKVKIRRAGSSNEKFSKVFEKKFRQHRKQYDRGTLDPDVAARLMYEVVAETIVMGWEGIADEKGKAIPYTIENAVKVFTDLPDWFEDIFNSAKDAANFRAQEEEDDVKNSQKS